MPRKRRIVVVGDIHHIMSRGLDGEVIFRDDNDRERFLTICGKALTGSGCLCYAWVLMDNHYHLILRPLDQSLQRIMRCINGSYARGYNKKYKRRGYLFQDRYKSLATQEFWYIRELIRYVHLNPVRAGLVQNIKELTSYRWSGHNGLLGENPLPWHSVEETLARFDTSRRKARLAYLRWMHGQAQSENEGWQPETISVDNEESQRTSDSRIAGDAEHVRKAMQVNQECIFTHLLKKRDRSDLETILKNVSDEFNVPVHKVIEKNRWSDGMKAKASFCQKSIKEYGYTHQAVAAFLQLNPSSVNRLAWKNISGGNM